MKSCETLINHTRVMVQNVKWIKDYKANLVWVIQFFIYKCLSLCDRYSDEWCGVVWRPHEPADSRAAAGAEWCGGLGWPEESRCRYVSRGALCSIHFFELFNWPYPQSSKMRKLPIIHANVDLPVSGFAHMFFMQNAYKIQVSAGFRALNSNYAAQCKVKWFHAVTAQWVQGKLDAERSTNLTFDRQFSDIIDEIDRTGYRG